MASENIVTNLRENNPLCFHRDRGNLYYKKRSVCIPIISNAEAVNSQNEDRVGAARRGGASPRNYSWKADGAKQPRDSWDAGFS